MRAADFVRQERGAATTFVAFVVTLMTIGGAALISDHVWLVDQRDTLKLASNAAGIAATQEMNHVLADNPRITDDDLNAALKPVAQAYIIANLQHISGDRYDRAVDTLAVEVRADRSRGKVDVSAQADLGGFLFASHLPFLSGVEQIEETAAEARTESVTNPIEVVLAIDVSASMERTLTGGTGTPSRMGIVKEAANHLVGILNPAAGSKVAIGVVPWHILVRLDDAARQSWESKGWADYPSSRRYAAAYACKTMPNCTSLDETQSLPADPGEEWQGCLDEHRVSAAGKADLPLIADLLDHPSENPFSPRPSSRPCKGWPTNVCNPRLPDNLDYQYLLRRGRNRRQWGLQRNGCSTRMRRRRLLGASRRPFFR